MKLYQLKKGDHFKVLDINGKPGNNVYIKGRPHTDITCPDRKFYVSFHYAPGKPYNHGFAGYDDGESEVVKVYD